MRITLEIYGILFGIKIKNSHGVLMLIQEQLQQPIYIMILHKAPIMDK